MQTKPKNKEFCSLRLDQQLKKECKNLRLNINKKAKVIHYITDDNKIIAGIDTEKAVLNINPLLLSLNLPAIQKLPHLLTVINLSKNPDKSNKTIDRMEIINSDIMIPKKELIGYKSGTKHGPLFSKLSHIIYLGKKLSLIYDTEIKTYQSSNVYHPSFFYLQILIPSLKNIQGEKWRKMYAKEIWQRIITQTQFEETEINFFNSLGIQLRENQFLSFTLKEWKDSILSIQPSHIFWKTKFEEIYNRINPNTITGFPPHMHVVSDHDKKTYAACIQLLNYRKWLYKSIVELKIKGTKPDTLICSSDIKLVEETLTETELINYTKYLEANKNKQMDYQWVEKAKNFISAHGIPLQFIGSDDLEFIYTSSTVKKIPIQKVLKNPSRIANGGIFTKSASRQWIYNENKWGAQIHSKLTPKILATKLRERATVPLFNIINSRTYELSVEETAAKIWQIMTHSQIENRGKNIRSKEGEKRIIYTISVAVKKKQPIDIIIFGPLNNAQSPLRTGKRSLPHFGHLDFLIQLGRINATIEQIYKPISGSSSVHYHWINESDAFLGTIDKRDSNHIQRFEHRIKEFINILYPDKNIFSIYHMGELLWGTQEKAKCFNNYLNSYRNYLQNLFISYEQGKNIDDKEKAWIQEKTALFYPIATIIDPYEYLSKNTSLNKIAVAYELIRARTQNKEEKFLQENAYMDNEIKKIADILFSTAREFVINHYIPIMESRYHMTKYLDKDLIPLYNRIEPWTKLYAGKIHGRITDGGTDRWWIKINSGTSLTHPTHGLSIIRDPLELNSFPSMSIRTWAEILSEQERFATVYLEEDENLPFHVIQLQ